MKKDLKPLFKSPYLLMKEVEDQLDGVLVEMGKVKDFTNLQQTAGNHMALSDNINDFMTVLRRIPGKVNELEKAKTDSLNVLHEKATKSAPNNWDFLRHAPEWALTIDYNQYTAPNQINDEMNNILDKLGEFGSVEGIQREVNAMLAIHPNDPQLSRKIMLFNEKLSAIKSIEESLERTKKVFDNFHNQCKNYALCLNGQTEHVPAKIPNMQPAEYR